MSAPVLRRRRVVRPRTAAVVLPGAVVTAVLGVLALGLGDYPLSPSQVVSVLAGRSDGFERIVVIEWRLPRALAAVVFGAALAVAGGVFQTLTRNPLASPDIVGLANGSFTGMLVALLVLGGGWPLLMSGSLVGGLAAAVLIYVLAYRGGIKGFRFIVVGIGVSAMLSSFNTWMLLRADVETALFASAWGAGTLNTVTAETAYPAAGAALALLAVLPFAAPALRQMDLGDDMARATGVRVDRARAAAIAVAVALVSTVTAVAGPIAFVALAAPQIARRLAKAPGIPLAASGTVGAGLLLASDLIAQHVIPLTVPVGVVTVVFGGAYLVWLLVHEARKGR
ncbi:FecCD family ABC transporter permease [Nocardiopsis baichengensis]|uniref:FecCD family ABC transporter permease n=1 Tax=Nocardiopsis baichengensis TaxID=280240 RepID=UPI000346B9F6|nr:iron chelate uptake ABC transporter family permease subunit [Nocardiopsis baichengensis]